MKELKVVLENLLAKFAREASKVLEAVSEGDGDSRLHYAIDRYRPLKMTQEDFFEEVADFGYAWITKLRRSS